MTNRRRFLAGVLAAGACPRPTWAEAGAPAFLSAARASDGRYLLCGLRASGEVAFTLPLPDRGHAAAAHPVHPLAVAFARRPGRFAVVLDCVTGQEIARLDAPEGRHFYGHGAFSPDGAHLFTSENAYDAARGVIGVWSLASGKRLTEFASGGVGPHDIKLMPDGQRLVVANGGIETHPDAGRAKLNIPLMEPNLSFLGLDGAVLDQQALDRPLHKNSIRHLAVAPDGLIGFAMQWQGDLSDDPPLLGLTRLGETPMLVTPPKAQAKRMMGYAGSVALLADHNEVAITSPRGGLAQVFDTDTGALKRSFDMADVCGVAATAQGFVLTSGTGDITHEAQGWTTSHALQWDNHLVPV
ncbi:DUF1513 domain-containing protein [Antarctobacter heliothermus]|uniref:Twin-arginine translocation pathway signal n=1 Tax=Antarctobacter heliothermus TaxID=74033 RepID=A0A239FB13_9RHOB|nr:DUF1513 domain-containing protein [Antarctobacter heliothermus]SNS53352.1 hypothetical protein SAMN04488078_10198 [Antarctobacter heliothermus]